VAGGEFVFSCLLIWDHWC